jgi:phage FluMu gp28-like protein
MKSDHGFFLRYQADWILDNSPLKILEKSRQIGMTLATAYSAVRRHVSKRWNYDTWVASRDEFQAKLFIGDCKKFAKILAPACDFFGRLTVFEEKCDSFSSLRFSNGTVISPLSSSVNSQVGKRGSRILDEFAVHCDQKNLYVTALPGITWGGQLEILSTHRGSNNFFNELIEEIRDGGNPKKFSYHRVTLQDALEQGLLDKLKDKLDESDERAEMSDVEYFDFVKRGCPDEESFLQEYMCVPSDDRSAFITSDMIANCEYKWSGKFGNSEQLKLTVHDDMGGEVFNGTEEDDCLPDSSNWELTSFSARTDACFLGVDIGRTCDLTVFWLLERREKLLLTRKILCMANAPFSTQERELQKFFTIKNLKRVCMDRTGIGQQFFERATENFGKYRVEGITFTNAVKEQLAYGIRTEFENETIRIPGDDFIRADLRSVRRETTFAGNIRFAGDRGKNGHADRFWALALAIHAANGSKREISSHFEAVGRRERRERSL